MRPKVVIAILLAACSVLGIAAWLAKGSRPQPAVSQMESPTVNSNPVPVTPTAKPATAGFIAPAVATNVGTASMPALQDEREEFISRRSAELIKLAMQDSPEAHQQIVDELRNPDQEIRTAALEAMEQADDRSVVPQMQQIADQTDDPSEKQAILDTIDFINLPSLTEYLHQHQK